MLKINKNLKFLKRKSKEVDEITDEIKSLVLEMGETMMANNGIGLAAPQVGVLKRVVIIKKDDGVFFCLVNPKILRRSREKEIMEEGCLSIPDCYLAIKRPKEIKVEFLNFDGKKENLDFDGFSARIIQHEIDHLNGILILNRISLKQKIKRFFKWFLKIAKMRE